MKYKKSPLDRFLEQRINDNAKELKQTLNETLRMEQNCLEQIRHSINHCKNNIAVCEKQIKKCSSASLAILETKKSAFKDNLLIWNTMGHIQMASIEMKEYMKRLSVESIDEWEERDVIKSVYTAIYETSKKLVDATADIFKFIKHYFPNYDYRAFTDVQKELNDILNGNTLEAPLVRNEQGGQDLILKINNLPVYYIEVKSRWSSDRSVLMTTLQHRTSYQEKEHYALCAADMTSFLERARKHEYPPFEQIECHLMFIPNIGELNSRLKDATLDNDSQVHIAGGYQVIVPQDVIAEHGISFRNFIDLLKGKIKKMIV